MNEKKGKILIVEYEKKIIDNLSEILQDECDIIVAKSIQQAAEYAGISKPDAILFCLNDFKKLKALHDDDSIKGVPLIFVSTLNDTLQQEDSLAVGAVDYISLPSSPVAVKARIKPHLIISHQKKMIETLAMIDSLTEIPNRASFQARLSEEWNRAARTATPLSLATIDIDYFKQFNEIYGHSEGDEVLKIVASTIVGSLKRAADFSARIGNAEFALIIPENSAEGAYMLMNDICRAIRKLKIPHEFSAQKILTVSVGGATSLPYKGIITKQEFISEVNTLLDKAKSNGRNTIEWADKCDES